ncbi:MAG: oxidoreductase-like domain-containing protein [Aquabacterium commune]|uniref:oxidoreductase-like domain-containing protein n=1 Tax=Aquabacterium TaxID=92793 RepID=UPI0025BDF5A2|nr:oxidoreductase-like domain-containing protein [Aquabacterium sp.]
MSDPASPDHDPMPLPPEAPDINACCGSGCDPCIFDTHDLAMADHRQALRAWQARQALKDTPQAAPPTA